MPNSVKYSIFIAFLEYIGCIKVSQKGSHAKYKKDGLKRPVIVPVKPYIYPSTLASNLETLEISYKDFLKVVKKNKLK